MVFVFRTVDSLHFKAVVVFCALSFLFYAIACLTTSHMKREFKRYGLERFRQLTGILQLLGVAGLLTGITFPAAGIGAAGGLTVQMLLALVARRKIKDSVIECLPAFFFCALNAWLLAGFLQAV